MRRFLIATMVPLTAAALASCSSEETTSTAPTTRTVVVEETTIAADEEMDPAEPTQQESSPTPETDSAVEEERVPSGVGSECNTVTSDGDSIEVKSNTSCEFAQSIYQAALLAPYVVTAPDPTVTGIPKADIMVTSPFNGETYALDCRTGSDGELLQCEGEQDPSGVGIAVRNVDDSVRWLNRLDITGY